MFSAREARVLPVRVIQAFHHPLPIPSAPDEAYTPALWREHIPGVLARALLFPSGLGEAMKLADRFRVLHALDGLAREHVRLSIWRGELMPVPSRSGEVSSYAKSLCREIAEAYEHPVEVGELIGARRAA